MSAPPRPRPPWLARRLVRWALARTTRDPILGDLDERFEEHAADSRLGARTWYWRQAISLLLHYRGRPGERLATSARGLAQDLRQAWRATRRSPASSAFVVGTLALGLGILLATVAAVRDVVFPAEVFRAQERTLAIWPEHEFSLGELDSMRAETDVFEALGGFRLRSMTLDTDDDSLTVNGARVSPVLTASLRGEPVVGGQLNEEHERLATERVALIGERLWRRRFAADPAIAGRRLRVDGLLHTVVGVLPTSSAFPGPGVEIVLPLELDTADPDFWPRHDVTVLGRVRPGISRDQAREDVVAAAAALSRRFPQFYDSGWGTEATVRPVDELLFGGRRDRAFLVLAAVASVFLAICANLAGLMLTRSLPRGAEFGTRAALGAGKARIARQLLVEHLLLGVLGGALAALLCTPLGRLLVRVVPGLEAAAPPSPALMGAGMALATLAAVVLGLPSVIDLWRRRLHDELAGHAAITGASRGRLQGTLVALQIGLACALVAGTAMLGRTIVELKAVDPGIDTARVIAVRLEAPRTLGATELGDALAGVVQRLRKLPGVQRVGTVSTTPYDQDAPLQPVNREEHQLDVARAPVAREQVVSPGTLELLGVRLLAGRYLGPSDDRGTPRVLLIDRALAGVLWPDDPLRRVVGRRIAVDPHDWTGWARIVGVVESTRLRSLGDPPPPRFFLPRAQAPRRAATILLRGRTDTSTASSLVRTLRDELPSVTVAWTRPLSELLRREWTAAAAAGRLFAVLGVCALALCMLGAYGVVGATVRRRRRELALRKALGASAGSVGRLVLRATALLIAAGLATGGVATALLGRSLEATLYGISSFDPGSLALAALLAIATVVAAATIPTLWAMRLPPAEALRARD